MTGTDLKFFTNEPERDLYSRFSAILKSNTQFFDVLVERLRQINDILGECTDLISGHDLLKVFGDLPAVFCILIEMDILLYALQRLQNKV